MNPIRTNSDKTGLEMEIVCDRDSSIGRYSWKEWRAAQWVEDVLYTLCSRKGQEITRAPCLRPIVGDHEELKRTDDGTFFISVRSA
jgi:hypothetical protein